MVLRLLTGKHSPDDNAPPAAVRFLDVASLERRHLVRADPDSRAEQESQDEIALAHLDRHRQDRGQCVDGDGQPTNRRSPQEIDALLAIDRCPRTT
jgi:hypothetical protein